VTTSEPKAESYASKTVRNVAWLGSTQLIRQGISIATTVVVARFLGPAEFGIFAMTLFINEIAQLFIDFGVGSALVQRKEVGQRLLSSCFWLSLAVACVGGLVVVGIGPFAADYFKQSIIAQLLIVSAANLAIGALAIVPQALLARALAFPSIALGTMIGSMVGAVSAVVLAANGAGVWTLVMQPLIGTGVTVAYIAYKARWRPSFVFDSTGLGGILRFSGHMLLGNLIHQVTRNLQQLILAPVMGAAAMGLLVMAQTVAWLPVAQFTSVTVRAIQPVFARMQDSPGQLGAGLFRTLAVVSLLAFPTLIGLACLADILMPVVFGAQWAAAWPLVSVLSGLSLLQCISYLAGSTLTATGRVDLSMKLSFVSFVLVGVTLWFLRDASLLAVTVGLAVAYGLGALVSLWVTLRNMSARARDLVAAIWRPALLSGFMAAVILGSKPFVGGVPPAGRLVLLILLGAACYAAATWLFNRATLLSLLDLVRRKS
jgi:O-antigen/teichoic acid export membrane protein